jgi:hypothetical protein
MNFFRKFSFNINTISLVRANYELFWQVEGES